MKRLALVLLVAVMAIPTFQSCKKGENDPSISLKSRNARITAKWKLTKIEGTETMVNSGTTNTITTTYDGITKTVTSTLFPTPNTTTGTYEMTIDKQGKVSWSETYTTTSPSFTDVQSATGLWYWHDSDKSKSMIDIDGGNHLFTGGLCIIDRLASKELILIDERNTNDNGDTDIATYKFTFEAQ
jgi:hypothetical protein